jgi:hypothetical protein
MRELIRPLPSKFLMCIVWAAACLAGRPAAAQDAPPRIPWFAVDVHGTVPMFPSSQPLADSRALGPNGLTELPGAGLGIDVAANIYPLKWRAVTFGIGGHLMTARSRFTADPATGLTSVNERFTYLGPALSLNFGTGAGWSYLSAGMNASTWSILPVVDGVESPPLPPDEQRVKTIDYGGGARWFAKPHLAFSFDVRFYAINPTTPVGVLPASPRTTLLVIGAGISIK